MSEEGASTTNKPPSNERTLPASPASRLRWKNMSRGIQTGADIAVVFTVLATVAIYFAGRSDVEHTRREEMAASLLTMKYSDTLRTSQQHVSDFIFASREIYHRAALARIAKKSFHPPTTSDDILSHMQKITDYYTDVAICAQQNLCDSRMIDIWFKNDMRNFICNIDLVGLPELRLRLGENYGTLLVIYVDGCGLG